MSRFTRLEKPLMSPGECMVCKSYALPVVDFNVSLQAINGKLYLCEECLQEALETINPEVFQSDNKDWEEYAHKLEAVIKDVQDELRPLADNTAHVFSTASTLPDVPVVSADASNAKDAEKANGGTKRDSKDTKGGTDKGKSANKKSGPNDVSSFDLDELLGTK